MRSRSFSFILGHFGVVTLGFAFVADVFAIAISGLFAVSCAIAFSKEEKQTTLLSIITGVLSFTFCVDVGTAIYYFSKQIKLQKSTI